ncbi:MAG: hypothetical protein KBB37_13675 [Bacteroidia bacterium]|nr:hypothetical protein [Bacteroidia bacterium]MBP7262329.1 hypothetical protein [Bacteroidia bacterium]MBP9725549.1 hypothetical protein [Bacteroidia bacterium]
MFASIKKIFRKDTVAIINPDINEQPSGEQAKFIWCLVGNIVEERLFGVDYEIKHGTNHFSSNTKVYCFPSLWGDGYENIKVIGRHRKASKNICIVMPAKFITNWRLQKVYRPYVIEVMQTQHGWTSSESDKETILEMLKWLPDRTIKIGE